jgi:hypothetical protein
MTMVEAKNGLLKLPHGKSYRMLVIQDSLLLPEVAVKIKKLADAGVMVIGKQFTASPSLVNYPECDKTVREISHHLTQSGKMKNVSLIGLLQEQKILPDFTSNSKEVLWVHRRIGDQELYFVVNQINSARIIQGSFRVTGKQPELWDPVTGKISKATSFEMSNGQTTVPLKLDPGGSIFVVFERPIKVTKGSSTTNWPGYTTRMDLKTAWTVNFDTKWGGPESVLFPSLTDWSKHELPGIRYYSGTATYKTQFELKELHPNLTIDLGMVKNLAEVVLNGIALGVVWKPPFLVDISKAVRPGLNELEVKVTNLWANRLIGDEQEPPDMKWDTKMAGLSSVKNAMAGYKLLELPDWFTQNRPRPSAGRYTFTTFNYFRKDSPLLESGLLGPVKLMSRIQ